MRIDIEVVNKLTEEIREAALKLLLGGNTETQAYKTILVNINTLRWTLLQASYSINHEEDRNG